MVGLENEQDFRNLVIERGADGHLVRLGEVADVRLAGGERAFLQPLNGVPGLMMQVQAQSKGNTLDIARGVREEVERIKETLPAGMKLEVSIDNAVPIEAALREVLIAVAFALASVLAGHLSVPRQRAHDADPGRHDPVSIVASLTVMYALGYSINVLTLLGLVLAIGLVVDDAIVVLENIHRRTELGEASLVAAITGSREIGFAVIATTLTLISVFVPISFLPGDLGRLFREFGFTLAAAVAFSALIALTLTPMLASRLPEHEHRNRFAALIDRFFKQLAQFYERCLRGALRHSFIVVAVLLGLIGVGFATFLSVPAEFTPQADNGRAFIGIESPEGSSFDYIDRYARQLETIALKSMDDGEVARVLVRVPGQGGNDLRTGDINTARAFLIFGDWDERQHTVQEIMQPVLAEARRLPGVRVSMGQPGGLGRGGLQSPVVAVIGGPTTSTSLCGPIKYSSSRKRTRGLRTSRATTRSASRRSACRSIATVRRTSASPSRASAARSKQCSARAS
jgi:multidrug efflux pump